MVVLSDNVFTFLLCILSVLLSGVGQPVYAQTDYRKTAEEINLEIRNRDSKSREYRYDQQKTTTGSGRLTCLEGISYEYKVIGNSYLKGGATAYTYLDEARLSITFRSEQPQYCEFRVTLVDAAIENHPINLRPQTIGVDVNGSGISNRSIRLSSMAKTVTMRVEGYVECYDIGLAKNENVSKVSCSSTVSIDLPPALKPIEPIGEVVIDKGGQSMEDGLSEDDFWRGKEDAQGVNDNKSNGFWDGVTEQDIFASFKVQKNSSGYVYVDAQGKVLWNRTFEFAKDFRENLGMVRTSEGVNFVDGNGAYISAVFFDEGRDFSEGLSAVRKGNKWGFINSLGVVAIPFLYDRVEDFIGGMGTGYINENEQTERALCSGDVTLSLFKRQLFSSKNEIKKDDKLYRVSVYRSLTLTTNEAEEWKKANPNAYLAQQKACEEKERAAVARLQGRAEELGYRPVEDNH